MSLPRTKLLLDMNGYQWAVLLAAWLGWGFDVFDGLLFNYVAPNCVPTLLHISLGTPEAKAAYQYWTISGRQHRRARHKQHFAYAVLDRLRPAARPFLSALGD